jgi:DNA-directed RNA polymerase subunit beta'
VSTYYQERDLHLRERFYHDQRVIFDSLILGLASPQQIQKWTQRQLPNGSKYGLVSHSKTIDYKSFRPIAGGLFCERIFGPLHDLTCRCGKKRPSKDITFCPVCEVEYTTSTARRRRLGYIELISPVTHIWYVKGRPNYSAVLLNKKPKTIANLVCCTDILVDPHHAGILPDIYTPFGQEALGKNETNQYRLGQVFPVASPFWGHEWQPGHFASFFTPPQEQAGDQPLWHYDSSLLSNRQWLDPLDSEKELEKKYLKWFMLESERESPQAREQAVRTLAKLTGGSALAKLLNRLDLVAQMRLLAIEIRALDSELKPFSDIWIRLPLEERRIRRLSRRRLKYIRRFNMITTFYRTQKNPAWMVLSSIPVLPPDLRPIMVMDGQVMSSDLNRLYQRVLFRNQRLKRSTLLNLNLIGYNLGLLQDAVDALFENGKGGTQVVLGTNDKPLKSLAEHLKGKRGRFRLNLLGKRVDYSGRSVIVVGPKMQLHACGLPREMALVLFLPFLVRRLIEKGYAKNIGHAKSFINYEHLVIWPLLRQIMKELPVLLNRAPTLHRLGIQAFQPRLVAGKAILLHPLVCSAFNADFDGDQMAVHVPLSFPARAEAWKLLWSRNNLLAPATGQPILTPSQDMVLGCYYLTTDGYIKAENEDQTITPSISRAERLGQGIYFADLYDVIHAFSHEHIALFSLIWVKMDPGIQNETTTPAEAPLEVQVMVNGGGLFLSSAHQERMTLTVSTEQETFQQAYVQLWYQYIRTTVGRIFVNNVVYAAEAPLPLHAQRRVNLDLKEAYGPKLNERLALELKDAPVLRNSSWKKLLALYKTPETRKSFRGKLEEALNKKL